MIDVPRGYSTALIGGAHTTEDRSAYSAPAPAGVIAQTNLYWDFQSAPVQTAKTVNTADLDFGIETGP